MGRSVYQNSQLSSDEIFYVDVKEEGNYFIHIWNDEHSFVKSIQIK